MALTLKAERDAGELRVTASGELDFATAPRLERFLEQLGDLRGWTLVIDLGDVSVVDSSGLAALLTAKLRGDRERFEVYIDRPTHGLQRMLEKTGLERVLREVGNRAK